MLLLTFAYCNGIPANAQEANRQVTFQHIRTGVSELDPINDIAEDKHGLIWFGSIYKGLFRYDGRELQHFSLQAEETKAKILQDSITCIAATPSGGLWVGYKNAPGISAFNFSSSRFSHYFFPDKRFHTIHNIVEFRQQIWVATNLGLYFLEDDVLKPGPNFKELPNPQVLSFFANDSSSLYLGVTGGIVEMNFKEEGGYTFHENIAAPDRAINTIIKDVSGNFWCSSPRSKLIWAFDLVEKRFVEDPINKQYPILNQHGRLSTKDIILDKAKRFWILSNSGIIVIDRQNPTKKPVYYKEIPYDSRALSSNKTYACIEDSNGVIWIATERGVNKFDPYDKPFNGYTYNPKANESLSDDRVYALFVDLDNNIWSADQEGKINFIDRSKSPHTIENVDIYTEKDIVQNKNHPIGFFDFIFDIAPLDAQHLLLATGNGVYTIDRNTMESQFLTLSNGATIDNIATQITHLKDGRIAFGLFNELGIYDPKSNTIQRFEAPHNMIGFVAGILGYEDHIILATVLNGLVGFDLAKQEFYEIEDEQGKHTKHAIYSLEHKDNTLWIGTTQKGLYKMRLKYQDGIVTSFTELHFKMNDGLGNNQIYNIIQDRNGDIWTTGNLGITRTHFGEDDTTFTSYNKEVGTYSNEFNQMSMFITPQGEILAGGQGGITTFLPDEIIDHPIDAKPVILSMKLLGDPTAEVVYSMLDTTGFRLNYNQNNLEFRFVATHYTRPSKNSFKYRLIENGKPTAWSPPTHGTTAIFTGKGSNHYVFEVMAANADGLWNEKNIARIEFEISSPFWRQTWFLITSPLAFLLIVFLVVSYRIRRERKANILLERLVADRTKEIMRQKEIIEAQNQELKVSEENLTQMNQKKDFIFSILSHDLRSPLTTLKGFLSLLIESAEIFSPKDIVEMASKMRSSVGNSLELIDNILFWSQSQLGSLNHNPEKLALKEIVHKSRELYVLAAERKGVDIISTVDESALVIADENMAFFIVRNLVSNALKFTPRGGEIKVYAEHLEEGMLHISVHDSGVGIKPEDLKRLFKSDDSFTRKGTSNEKGTGLGLVLCKKFAEMNNGRIWVESEYGHGAKFTFTLPLAGVMEEEGQSPVS